MTLGIVLANWAALIALWALPYLNLLEHLHLDAARSQILQWSLAIIGAVGVGYLLYTAWKDTRDPVWRAKHGLPMRGRGG